MNGMKIKFNDDGSISVDSSGMKGSTADIMKLLNGLASTCGGELVVEKHVGGIHHHHEGDEHEHTHG